MLQIKRIRIEIHTEKGLFGFDETFEKKVQLIWSGGNTVGKSSILSSIFYCLGMEEIIGGKGNMVLSPVFKRKLNTNNEDVNVLESKIYLEIDNGNKTNTILRSIIHDTRSDSLATVYNSEYNSIHKPQTTSKDYYIHGPNSASNDLGFFIYLENFLNLNLPMVPNRRGTESKLYLQLIFSGMFIEQKRGWADFFSAMPHFGLIEPKKRVVEYLLNLDSLQNEKEKKRVLNEERTLKDEWKTLYSSIYHELAKSDIYIHGLSNNIEILNPDVSLNLIVKKESDTFTVDEYVEKLKKEHMSTSAMIKNDSEHIENAQKELDITLSNIQDLNMNIINALEIMKLEDSQIDDLQERLLILEKDIDNNQDAYKLKKIGSKQNIDTFKDTCPTCNQKIVDSVLLSQNSHLVMAIEENISHLKAQKTVFIHSLEQKKRNVVNIKIKVEQAKKAKSNLENIARLIKNDIYSLDGSYSEETVYKKVKLFNEINNYKDINKKIESKLIEFKNLSERWKTNRAAKSALPSDNLSKKDIIKLKTFKTNFINNLEEFDFSSITDFKEITISHETYLPAIDGFDLKFDSSASDYIRGIWSFTVALLQTSIEHNGNHFGLIIFDEPGQHNIIKKDIDALFNVLKSINGFSQTFIGITTESIDIHALLKQDSSESIQAIEVKEKAFKLLI